MALSLGIILKDERQNCAQVSPLIISKSMFRIYLKIKWNKRTKTAFNSNQSQEVYTQNLSSPPFKTKREQRDSVRHSL